MSRRQKILSGLLVLQLFLLLVFLSLVFGRTDPIPAREVMRALLVHAGFVDSQDALVEAIVRLRFFRALTAAGTGAAFALAGALLQGVFRNGLASPSLIGVSAGASLGASSAIVVLGGYIPSLVGRSSSASAPLVVAGASFLGAISAVFLVLVLAQRRGRISVPVLLLTGIAVNACLGGALAAIQALTLDDYEVSRAIISWSFGHLDDKSSLHVWTVGTGLLLAAMVIPFVASELDLFAAGEEDAASLGVAVARTKFLCVAAAALSASAAVAVAGQIAFVGLLVPHLIRLLLGRSHRRLLPAALVGGAFFLLGCELMQLILFGAGALRPGVVMSVVGGPFFLVLLARRRSELGTL